MVLPSLAVFSLGALLSVIPRSTNTAPLHHNQVWVSSTQWGPSSTTVKNMTGFQNKVMRSPENIHVKSKATPSEHHSLNLICTPPRRVWAPSKYICQCHNSRSAMLRERWGGRAPSSDLQPSEFAAVSQQPTKAGKKPATEPSNGLLSRAWPGST